MTIHKPSSRDRREEKDRHVGAWVKWSAVVLSITLLAATLLLVNRLRTISVGVGLPVSVDLAKPIVAR